MSKIFIYLMCASVVLAVTGFVKRNKFPEVIPFVKGIEGEPYQKAVDKPVKTLQYKEVTYIIQPKYEYDLVGLVVSYTHHDGDRMLHKLWNDHLNAADLCVVWGDSAATPFLNRFSFWNGQFTCNFKTNNNEAWKSFNINQLSNNHLITADEYIRGQIKDLKIGDQVRVQGWLSSYKSKGGGERGTSTVRTDTGNGACETILVDKFQVLVEGNHLWRKIFKIAMLVFFVSLVGYFFTPHRVSG